MVSGKSNKHFLGLYLWPYYQLTVLLAISSLEASRASFHHACGIHRSSLVYLFINVSEMYLAVPFCTLSRILTLVSAHLRSSFHATSSKLFPHRSILAGLGGLLYLPLSILSLKHKVVASVIKDLLQTLKFHSFGF